MAQSSRYIDMSALREVPAWERLVDEVRTTKKPAIIRADGEDLAEVRPLPPKRRRRPPSRALPVTEGDPLFRLIGIGRSGKSSNASEQKHEALTDAYRSSHHS